MIVTVHRVAILPMTPLAGVAVEEVDQVRRARPLPFRLPLAEPGVDQGEGTMPARGALPATVAGEGNDAGDVEVTTGTMKGAVLPTPLHPLTHVPRSRS